MANAGEARIGLRTSPRLPAAAVVNASEATAATDLVDGHANAHALPLRNLDGRTSNQLHCVVCGSKTSTYCSVCPSSSATCVPMHAPVDFRGKRRACFATLCREPTKRARSSPAKKADNKRKAPAEPSQAHQAACRRL